MDPKSLNHQAAKLCLLFFPTFTGWYLQNIPKKMLRWDGFTAHSGMLLPSVAAMAVLRLRSLCVSNISLSRANRSWRSRQCYQGNEKPPKISSWWEIHHVQCLQMYVMVFFVLSLNTCSLEHPKMDLSQYVQSFGISRFHLTMTKEIGTNPSFAIPKSDKVQG